MKMKTKINYIIKHGYATFWYILKNVKLSISGNKRANIYFRILCIGSNPIFSLQYKYC